MPERPLVQVSALEVEDHAGSTRRARMPHNELAGDDLDAAFPSLQATDEPQLEDLTRLEDDRLYAAGMLEVQKIIGDMSHYGRTRRTTDGKRSGSPAIIPMPCGTNTTAPTESSSTTAMPERPLVMSTRASSRTTRSSTTSSTPPSTSTSSIEEAPHAELGVKRSTNKKVG